MFEIETQWISADAALAQERQTAAELTLRLGDQVLTRGYDTWSQTVTDRVPVSAYPLASWLASNWWRLRHEPVAETDKAPTARWRLAHDLTAAGSGYVWPAIRMSSDGETMQIGVFPSRQGAWETMLYQTVGEPVSIETARFDQAVDDFIELTIARLRETGADAAELATLWQDIRAERADVDVAAWRRMEARLGYDPDTAPDGLMWSMAGLVDLIGAQASDEVAPLIGSTDSVETLEELKALANMPGCKASFAIPAYVPTGPSGPPWERGRAMAHWVRTRLQIPAGPVSDIMLSDLLGVSREVLASPPMQRRIALGVRRGNRGEINLHFRRNNPSGRRFEAARFLADHLAAPDEDRWLPQTNSATARQKLQRAFAVEFLVPIEDLTGFLGNDQTDEAIDEAGVRYGVSALAVKRHLVNHGLVSFDRITGW